MSDIPIMSKKIQPRGLCSSPLEVDTQKYEYLLTFILDQCRGLKFIVLRKIILRINVKRLSSLCFCNCSTGWSTTTIKGGEITPVSRLSE